MANVFVHVKDSVDDLWTNQQMEFDRIPGVGEYVVLKFDSPWYEVHLVVHCPYEGAEYDAEIYAVRVNHLEEISDVTAFARYIPDNDSIGAPLDNLSDDGA